LVLMGDTPLLVREDGEIIDLVRKGQGVLNIVPLSPVVLELNEAILVMFPKASARDETPETFLPHAVGQN
jgi:hypothetical protein